MLVRAGTPRDLEHGPVPLYEREELVQIVTKAIHIGLAVQGERIPEECARIAAHAVLRGIMAAGLTVSESPPPDPAA